jgi:glycosyltransferase involved in cell wall biosynthesis
MAGPAIRAWHVAAALSREHDVRLASTTSCSLSDDRFTTETATTSDAVRHLEQWCDVFIFQGTVLDGFPFLGGSAKVMVVDVYDPMHLEQLEQTRDTDSESRERIVRHAVVVLNDQLLRGDFFMCASAKQRALWLGHLSALGRVNPATYDEDGSLGSRLAVVPFGLQETRPSPSAPAVKGVIPGIGPHDDLLLWGGGIYNWFDPLTLIRAMNTLRSRWPTARLLFMGVQHPNVPTMRMALDARRLSDELGLTGSHVFFNEGWVPYDRRHDYLLEADVGVSTHLDHLETEFSFRTRILDYLWAGLPIVTTQGDSFAELVEQRQLGLTVPAQDVEALAAALLRILGDADLRTTCRKHVEEVAPDFAWDKVLEPLLTFCRNPSVAPDRTDDAIALALERSRSALAAPRGWRRDMTITIDHFRRGGVRQVVRKAASRVGHTLRSLAGRPPR